MTTFGPDAHSADVEVGPSAPAPRGFPDVRDVRDGHGVPDVREVGDVLDAPVAGAAPAVSDAPPLLPVRAVRPGPLIHHTPPPRAVARLGETVAAPYAVVRRSDDVAAVLTRLYAVAVRGHPRVHVLQLSPWPLCDVGQEIAEAGRIIGDVPGYEDATPDLPPDLAAERIVPGAGPTLVALRRESIDGAALRVLRHAQSAILVTETARHRAGAVRFAAEMLDGLGVAVGGLVVVDGRLPRDPSYGDAPRRPRPPRPGPGPAAPTPPW